MTSEMIEKGTWKELEFKALNLNAMGKELSSGNLHPLLKVPIWMKVRQQFREILLQMGFCEMPTNQYAESSFFNFDTLFQPQQHPARDAHDTFFLSDPKESKVVCPDYWKRVQQMHEKGDESSLGWRVTHLFITYFKYNWNIDEAKKNIMRTHTTAV